MSGKMTRRAWLAGSAAALAAPPAFAVRLSDEARPFDRVSLVARARALARTPFDGAEPRLPDALARLTYEQHARIRFRADDALWRDAGAAFRAQFFHPGAVFKRPVHVHEVADGVAREILFEPASFDYGETPLAGPVPPRLGFAGLRLHHPLNRPDVFDELIVFLGASYFRALGRNQNYGLSARGLAVNTATTAGEEFPFFREFWLERPAPSATQATVHALLDGPSATGAYTFLVTPGETVVSDVTATLFLRKPVERLGLAPLTTMFLHGGGSPPRVEDYRPRVHDSDGLSLWTSAGEFVWRPLVNPRRLRLSVFQDQGLRGFGLMQRAREFRAYQDIDARFERRPSAWVEPVAGFGRGAVMLIEIPSDAEYNDNVVAFWTPAQPPEPGQPTDFRYRLHWGAAAPHRAPGAEVVATRTGYGGPPGKQSDSPVRRFMVDFRGGALERVTEPGAPTLAVTASAGRVEYARLQRLPDGGWRLTFEFRPEGARSVELRAYVKLGAEVASETWSYQWAP
jgi:periplasmic glucans biosynthesis protein